MSENISRRDLLKFGGVVGASAAIAGLAGCAAGAENASSASASSASASSAAASSAEASASAAASSAAAASAAGTTTGATLAAGHAREGLPNWLEAPAQITDISEEKDFDIVVVGAGAPGCPAALIAAENGAKVALIQKQARANAYGNTGSGVDLKNSDPAQVAALLNLCLKQNQYRSDVDLMKMWFDYGGEAVSYVIEKATEGGAQVVDQGNQQHAPTQAKNGWDNITMVTSFFGPKPYNTGNGMQDLCTVLESAGVEIFYETPAQQLVVNDSGAVTGVIAQAKDGSNIQFNASKGVIMATGDYQCDTDMLAYYLPDMVNLEPKQDQRTGDGHKMVIWAGGCMENIGHTKMLHDFDAGPASMCDMPFLRTKMSGERFVNETVEMSVMNCFLNSAEDGGEYVQVFDNDYMEKAAEFPGKLVDPEEIRVYIPEDDGVSHDEGVLKAFINTHKADTIEELAELLEIKDVDTFKASIDRWNEICDAGSDPDFGLPAQYLKKIDTPPYWGIHRHVRFSAFCSGVKIDRDLQCLTPEGEKIEGLYAIGNCSGGFYGGIDYPLDVPGMNLGRNYTQGYCLGRALATGKSIWDFEPVK